MTRLSLSLASGALRLLLALLRAEELPLFAPMCFKRRCLSRVQNMESDCSPTSLLDLPELAMEKILSRLPPESLSQMARVSKELRGKCRSDRLWEPHLQAKWGKIAQPATFKEWLNGLHRACTVDHSVCKALIWPLACVWPLFGLKSRAPERIEVAFPSDSFMTLYWALETGAFWFPAQVYNREHGHVGFLLSCYDAELSYDRRTDTFRARYPPHGSRTVVTEEGVQWERLRCPPVATPAHELHVSDCLDELRPGDHVEVQWRRNKDFPYGWWYGVVGHLDSCDRERRHCNCQLADTLWLEFNQYTLGSRWRRAAVNRKTHREEGNEAEGFYAGIRKLCSKGEISTWKELWLNETLD